MLRPPGLVQLQIADCRLPISTRSMCGNSAPLYLGGSVQPTTGHVQSSFREGFGEAKPPESFSLSPVPARLRRAGTGERLRGAKPLALPDFAHALSQPSAI